MHIRTSIVALCAAAYLIAAPNNGRWVATWIAAPSPQMPTVAERTKEHLELDNQTIREIVHTSIGGTSLRIRLSNVFGSDSVQIGAVHVANCLEAGQIVRESDRVVTFSGRPLFTIPPDAPFISDPVDLAIAPATNLCISIYLPNRTMGAGIHYDARQKNYLAPGDATAAPVLPNSAVTVNSWFFLAGLDVMPAESSAAIVAFGDSITDGAASTLNANKRWPNVLADRLLAAHRDLAVVDAGIGGNRILHDAKNPVTFGVNALARFGRDALNQPGVKYIIVLEGINDLGHAGTSAPLSEAVTADDLIAALKQLIERAHERDIKIFGATLTPFEGTVHKGYFTPEKETQRVRLNDWIRSSRAFDGVIDFEKAIADPANPTRILSDYDSGDHLHPNDAGYKAMAEAVNLALFR